MTMPPTDLNQQMLAHLQMWRQLLEQWTTMAGLPLLSPATNPAPVTPPPAAPSPADYTQQLFTNLQTWRQYLEQATGAPPSSAQATGAPPSSAQASGRPDVVKKPEDQWATQEDPVAPPTPGPDTRREELSAGSANSGQSWPPEVHKRPALEFVNQFDRFRRGLADLRLDRPSGPVPSEAQTTRTVRSAFRDATKPVSADVARQIAPKTLYRTLTEVQDVRRRD